MYYHIFKSFDKKLNFTNYSILACCVWACNKTVWIIITLLVCSVISKICTVLVCQYKSIYLCVCVSRASGWGGVLWHLWKYRWYNRGWHCREGRAAQTSGQHSTAGGKKGAHHCQALLPEEQEGVCTLLTFTLSFLTCVCCTLFGLCPCRSDTWNCV